MSSNHIEISFLIVTKNRHLELGFTLQKLKKNIDLSVHEVLVFIDGCNETEKIKESYKWVKWFSSYKSMSASPARKVLYGKAKGVIFIGLDDDAHPISENFITQVEKGFKQNKKLGIIAFQEVRGLYKSDEVAILNSKINQVYYTSDFVGCGFAIKKQVYNATNGFPIWMDIYGEESALAIEVLDLGYQILYDSSIIVNHRVDIAQRKKQGRNYFRFEHQLKNSIRFYLVYYNKPIFKILKLSFHNFKKYAISDFKYFKLYFKVYFLTSFQLFSILKYRKPVKRETITLKNKLKGLNY